MKRILICTALLASFAASGTKPSHAQGMAADLMPPYEISTIVTSMGLRPLGRPVWRGDRYVLFAVDRYGQQVRVVLDAQSGQVLAVRPAMRGYAQEGGVPPYGYDQGYAPPQGYPAPRPAPYDPRYGATPPPPGAVPGRPPVPGGEDEYFDDDQQQGARPPHPGAPRMATRDVPTGSVSRQAPAPKEKPVRDATPVPRPRPALARANEAAPAGPKAAPAPQGAAKPDPGKPQAASEAPRDPAKEPAKEAAKEPAVAQSKAPAEVRVIDLGKQKPEAATPPKPGEAIRF